MRDHPTWTKVSRPARKRMEGYFNTAVAEHLRFMEAEKGEKGNGGREGGKEGGERGRKER